MVDKVKCILKQIYQKKEVNPADEKEKKVNRVNGSVWLVVYCLLISVLLR